MMKFILMIFFMNFMMYKNKFIMFYYNLLFIISGMVLFMYMNKDMMWYNITLFFGMEYYSIFLVVLSIWIISLMLMCLSYMENLQMIVILNLLCILLMFFMSMDLLLFYMMFEISLIPTFFLIIYWGNNPERLSAAYYLLMYMLFFSFPLLVYLFKMYNYSCSMDFSLMELIMGDFKISLYVYIMIYMSFFIKMPMYVFHIWLPKAHVEAPVYGSMILAGVLLKMGSYGLIRIMKIFMKSSVMYNYLIFSISIVGSVMVSMLCLIQVDLKSLVAYSSVVHMNMMLCSILTLFNLGFLSSYIMMISHGLCSSGLFYMVDLYYKRSSSRLLLLNKGMMNILPNYSLWWFLFCMANFSFPFSLNFISELLMLSLLLNWNLMFIYYLMMVCFLSSAYSLYLYSYIQHGHGSNMMSKNMEVSVGEIKEYLVLFFHFYPMLLYLLNLVVFM